MSFDAWTVPTTSPVTACTRDLCMRDEKELERNGVTDYSKGLLRRDFIDPNNSKKLKKVDEKTTIKDDDQSNQQGGEKEKLNNDDPFNWQFLTRPNDGLWIGDLFWGLMGVLGLCFQTAQ